MKRLGTAAVFATAMFAAVGTANATDPTGTYNVVFDHRDGYGDDIFQWTLTSCGQGCLHVTGDDAWQGDFHLVHGQWTLTQQNVPNSVRVQRWIETRWRHDAYVRPDQPQRQVDGL